MTDSGKTEEKPTERKLITRRRVLFAGGTLVGAGALAAGGFLAYDRALRFGRDPGSAIADHRVQLPPALPPMAIARGTDPAVCAHAAIEKVGGMRRFVGRDDVVVIKPNIGWERTAAQAANTNPLVVAQVVRECREAGARRVIVSDCPVAEARGAFEKSGILAAARDAGAQVILPEESEYRSVKISDRLGTWDVLDPFVIATKLINVPVAKHHSLTGATAGMKNWIGITGKLRIMFHDEIQRSIAELAALMRPTLTVVDASRVMMETGPQGGSLSVVKNVGAVAAGVDPLALDAWAFSLFGVGPDTLPESLLIGERMGLGNPDYEALSPVEIITDA